MSTTQPAPTQVPSPSSSSTTLWATASKQWVIPAKPKPGRKPKKDPTPADPSTSEIDEKARRGQNRAAQRAFRTRKQEQLQELQARIEQYEKGEIERNISLQNVAKRLKEENDRLRAENQTLREQLQTIEGAYRDKERKRAASPSSETTSSMYSSRKRTRITVAALINSPITSATAPSIYCEPSPPPSVCTQLDAIPSLSLGPSSLDEPMVTERTSHTLDFSEPVKTTTVFKSSAPIPTFDDDECGLCSKDASCVCLQLGLREKDQLCINDMPLPSDPFENDPIARAAELTSSTDSILDNLPAFQPAVPLRRRNMNPDVRIAPIFPVFTQTPISDCGPGKAIANCSGDPSNCAACADDSFGQAFCAAVGESLASSRDDRCSNCPSRAVPGVNLPEAAAAAAADACCGGSTSGGCCRNTALTLAAPAPQPVSSNSLTIPCNQAWQQIKAHPNAAFADLRLLADVVARRSKCTGPRVVISPAPGTATPDRAVTPGLPTATSHRSQHQSNDAHAPHGLSEQEIHIKCGRPSVRELPAEAVRDALRLLEIMHPRK